MPWPRIRAPPKTRWPRRMTAPRPDIRHPRARLSRRHPRPALLRHLQQPLAAGVTLPTGTVTAESPKKPSSFAPMSIETMSPSTIGRRSGSRARLFVHRCAKRRRVSVVSLESRFRPASRNRRSANSSSSAVVTPGVTVGGELRRARGHERVDTRQILDLGGRATDNHPPAARFALRLQLLRASDRRCDAGKPSTDATADNSTSRTCSGDWLPSIPPERRPALVKPDHRLRLAPVDLQPVTHHRSLSSERCTSRPARPALLGAAAPESPHRLERTVLPHVRKSAGRAPGGPVPRPALGSRRPPTAHPAAAGRAPRPGPPCVESRRARIRRARRPRQPGPHDPDDGRRRPVAPRQTASTARRGSARRHRFAQDVARSRLRACHAREQTFRLRALPRSGRAQHHQAQPHLSRDAPNSRLLHEPVVVPHDELRLDLIDGIHRHADDDQQRRAAEEEVHVQAPA